MWEISPGEYLYNSCCQDIHKTHLRNIQTLSFTVIWGKHELVPLLGCAVIHRKHTVLFLKLLLIFCAQACQWLCIQQFVSVIEIHFVLWLQWYSDTVWLINWEFEPVRCDVISLGEWFPTLWRFAFFFRLKQIKSFFLDCLTLKM